MFQFAQEQSALRDAITQAYRLPEKQAVHTLASPLRFDAQTERDIETLASSLIQKVRKERSAASGVDALMHEFSLSSDEGIALMCLAEALLRVPDNATRDRLIKDKLADGDWKSHIGNSPSVFVNAAAWGLLLTGKLSKPSDDKTLSAALGRVLQKGGEPFIRGGVNYAMKLLGKQFVTGQTIDEALANGKNRERLGYRFSFDMLGEAAMTAEDADRYYNDYQNAIHAIGKDAKGRGVYDGNGISVKLSAIHPRYFRAQKERVMAELLPRLKALFLLAKEYDIGLNIDAEEANRLELSLDLLEKLVADPDLQGFLGIGFVVQAYQKRCPYVLDYIIDLARRHKQRLMIRLVKGAYWDSEIKWAQVDGLNGYPVYTQKAHTDVSYLACAKKILEAPDAIFGQFATHNAQTLATIYQMGKDNDFEFQCLHGMGETLYDQVVGEANLGRRVRIYAPVGTHKTLLAYLVRRLLENGANSSFVNRIVDEKVGVEELVASPLTQLQSTQGKPNPLTPNPKRLYSDRQNSQGFDLSNEHTLQRLQRHMSQAASVDFEARPLVGDGKTDDETSDTLSGFVEVKNPADRSDTVGRVRFSDPSQARKAVDTALEAKAAWQAFGVKQRADVLRKFADLMEEEKRAALLMTLAVREAGKTLPNAIGEVREAVDFCRYYANEAERLNLNAPLGVVVAISPWNFPLAIFVGEVVAALAAGNTVVAKPAEQTSLIAHLAVSWLHEAGVPKAALQLVLGAGDVGAALTQDPRTDGVIFTGSTEVAQRINQTLAEREDNPVLIAETGGMNAMIVDSTALPEQVCMDVLSSAFDSAGQRCSALRILCLQSEIADRALAMIKGAMDELCVDDPSRLATDVGPVIDDEAKANLQAHIDRLKAAYPYHEIQIQSQAADASFVAPTLFELDDLDALKREVFGPVLHVVRYESGEIDRLIETLNAKGYALTHGVHSRIDRFIDGVGDKINAGNVYINRNIVGAVVGVQPFGGHGLSGTGPKAGGPFYLQRLSRLKTWIAPQVTNPKPLADNAAPVVALAKALLSPDEAEQVERAAKDAAKTSLRLGYVDLQGPTGEINRLSYLPPHHAYVRAGAIQDALRAVAALAVNGITAILDDASPLAPHQNALSPLVRVDPNAATNHALIVALERPSVQDKKAFAQLDGPIRRLIDAQDGLDVAQLYHERSLSYNTTAAGGNASLMANA